MIWEIRQKLEQRLQRFKETHDIMLGYHYYPLHGDKFLQDLVDEIIKNYKVTHFIETGTFCGDTSKYIGQKYPNVIVLTCEKYDVWRNIAINNLKDVPNVHIADKEISDSISFLKHEVAKIRISNRLQPNVNFMPLFFLDAHWYNNNPIEEEINIISQLDRFICIIDDLMYVSNSVDKLGHGYFPTYKMKKYQAIYSIYYKGVPPIQDSRMKELKAIVI